MVHFHIVLFLPQHGPVPVLIQRESERSVAYCMWRAPQSWLLNTWWGTSSAAEGNFLSDEMNNLQASEPVAHYSDWSPAGFCLFQLALILLRRATTGHCQQGVARSLRQGLINSDWLPCPRPTISRNAVDTLKVKLSDTTNLSITLLCIQSLVWRCRGHSGVAVRRVQGRGCHPWFWRTAWNRPISSCKGHWLLMTRFKWPEEKHPCP